MVGLPGILASGTMYFALNTEMRWRALQAGQVYVRQHPGDARLSVEELHDMVDTSFSSHVCHYAGSLRGVRQYWMKHICASDCFFPLTVLLTFSGQNWQT